MITLLHANLCADRYDYNKTWRKRSPKFVRWFTKNYPPDILTLTECTAPSAVQLVNDLRTSGRVTYVSSSFWGSTVMWRPEVFKKTRNLVQVRWLSGTQTHSLFGVELTERATGQAYNVLVSHFPPGAARTLLRRRQMATITAKTAKWHDPTVLAMDANWSRSLETFAYDHGGWQSARERALTRVHPDFKTSGGVFGKGNPIDYVFGRNGARFGHYEVIDGRAWSDHNALLVEVRK